MEHRVELARCAAIRELKSWCTLSGTASEIYDGRARAWMAAKMGKELFWEKVNVKQ